MRRNASGSLNNRQHPPEKDMLLSMASAWRRLAEHAEKNDDQKPDEQA